MNYEEVARKIEKEFGDAYYFSLKSDGAGGYLSYELADAIAAALRRAANEAAWDGYEAGAKAQDYAWRGRIEQCHYCEEMHAETYGPRPQGEPR